MAEWSVLVEVETARGDVDDDAVDEFVGLLADVAGVVAVGPAGWSARVTLELPDTVSAVARAAELVPALASKAGMPPGTMVATMAQRQDLLAAELERPQLPVLLGTPEVLERLGVSRQRLHELRKEGRFPAPAYELAAGPLWLGPAVEAFLERWDRRPGRPAKALDTTAGYVLLDCGQWVDPKWVPPGATSADCPTCGKQGAAVVDDRRDAAREA